MKDIYEILGYTRDADYETVKARYEELKAIYSEQRFMDGEEGNEGARKLNELEDAWRLFNEDRARTAQSTDTGGGFDYSAIDQMIKNAEYDKAQTALDSITDRNGEWHYLQSIIFYKREWLTECRQQLQMAIDLDPYNQKYKSSLEKLDMLMGNPNANPRAFGNAQQFQQQQPNEMDSCANCLSSCCCAYCLTDCCCNGMNCCM